MLFLTPAELIELTERKRKSEQIAWLRVNDYPYAVGANGHPRVFREYVHQRLTGIVKSARQRHEPNWGAI